MFRNYLKTTLRNLLRNKIYSAINIIGLSLGLTCAMLILLYTRDELSFDRFHKNVNHIYQVVSNFKDPVSGSVEKISATGYFQGPRYTANIPEIQNYVRVNGRQHDIKKGTDIISQEMLEVDSGFFSVFSFPLLQGNPATALKQPNSIVISEKKAIELFGNTNALGKTILCKKEESFDPFIVTGIAKACPQNSTIKFDILIPLKVPTSDQNKNETWFNCFLNTFVVLRPGANINSVEAKMKRVFESEASETIKMIAEKYGDKKVRTNPLIPFTSVHLSKDYAPQDGLVDGSNPMYSYILSGIAFFILLIACINFVNLTIARSLKRAKEIGIRKVIGSERRQLIIQFLGESFILSAAAFILAILIVQLALPTFNRLSNKELAFSYLLDTKLVIGYISLFIITGLLSGFYPSLVLSSYKPVQTLYNRFKLAGKNYLQKILVVLQFALATLLIIATITIFSQFKYLTTTKLGYDDSNLVIITKWRISRQTAQLLKEELLKSPGIVAVAGKNGGRWGTTAHINGDVEIGFDYETVDETYIPLLKISMAAGRNFSPDFPSDSTHAVLVNEAFAKQAGWKNPVGQEVNFWYNNNEKYTVVGVVKDYHFRPLNEKIPPQLFTMKPGNDFGKMIIKIRPGTETSSLQHIEKTYKKIFPLTPYTYKFQDQENFKNYEAESKWKQMMAFGAVLTIFISCIGLFGLSVLSAERRTKEIGIRKVLGISVSGVVTILSKDFLKLVTIAMLIAMPAAWYLTNKWLENYTYRIHLSWWMFTLAGLLVILIAMVTVSFQAFKAAITNPVKNLRTE